MIGIARNKISTLVRFAELLVNVSWACSDRLPLLTDSNVFRRVYFVYVYRRTFTRIYSTKSLHVCVFMFLFKLIIISINSNIISLLLATTTSLLEWLLVIHHDSWLLSSMISSLLSFDDSTIRLPSTLYLPFLYRGHILFSKSRRERRHRSIVIRQWPRHTEIISKAMKGTI